ncbi:OmpA family protein [Pseudocolwellia sp. AS88]|jgi:outer membrane protein OmpA-like peptidoglycan-associated protein|uniref:OmpA family protein n=1 Tax=Pseudocolwellia sp. AS88 TaxID=3063958 RepID=UPI0026EF0870|nr:OmpA family protein [Pseudocolwellia sp. AS88]MDO7086734.1 OmpA family protein [Pseudocolwellia sp. AS88]
MKFKKSIISAITLSLIISGCASTNAGKGAAIGAVAGAVLGKSTSNHKDKRLIWGAAIGAIAGAAVGDYMDKQEEEFREELSGSGIEVIREGDNIRLVMPSNITFATGQSYITSGFHATLNDVAKVLTKFDKTYLSIEGHTDSQGSYEFNQNLSEQRAVSVKNYLVQQNILDGRLQVTGYGETQPLVDNSTEKNRAINRRVEIQIIPSKA